MLSKTVRVHAPIARTTDYGCVQLNGFSGYVSKREDPVNNAFGNHPKPMNQLTADNQRDIPEPTLEGSV